VRVMDSLSISKDLTDGNKLTLFVIGLLAAFGGLAVIILTCGLGLFVVAPFLALMYPVIYLMITGQPTADQLWTQEPAQ